MLDSRVVAVAGEPLRITGRTATGGRATVQSDVALGSGTIAPRRPRPVRHAAWPIGRHDLPARAPRDDDRRSAHGADERAQPVAPGARRRARRARRRPATAHDRARPGLADGFLEPITSERDRQRDSIAPEAAPSSSRCFAAAPTRSKPPLAVGIATIYADYQDIKRVRGGRRGRPAGRRRRPSTWRRRASRSPARPTCSRSSPSKGPTALLVRNAGGMRFCSERGIPFVADFSLNAANPLTVELLKRRGATRVTASYDLNVDQLLDLVDATPPSWLEVVIHQQIPMFHMEHCVYCAFLSPGTDATNCGRPCDHHDVKLRDRVGVDHPLKADVGLSQHAL